MGPTLDEPQSFGQGSHFGRSWEYGGLYGIRSSRRNDWNYSQPERRHGQSLDVNHFIPWVASVQVCGRKRMHPFRKERPSFGGCRALQEKCERSEKHPHTWTDATHGMK